MLCANCEIKSPAMCRYCGADRGAVAVLDEPDDELWEAEDKTRSAAEIAMRALTLSAVVSCAYGAPKTAAIDWLKKEGLWRGVTPQERTFLEGETRDEDRCVFTWKIEALVPLLWAIGKIERMPTLAGQCDTGALKNAVVWAPDATADYVRCAQLRDEREILREYEKVYQAHWTVRDARLNETPVAQKLDPEVVAERHYGFNWVTGYMGQAWDDITTDT
jgi:hypothetical protein